MLEVVGGDLLYSGDSGQAQGQGQSRGQFSEAIGLGDNEISTLNDQVSAASAPESC